MHTSYVKSPALSCLIQQPTGGGYHNLILHKGCGVQKEAANFPRPRSKAVKKKWPEEIEDLSDSLQIFYPHSRDQQMMACVC